MDSPPTTATPTTAAPTVPPAAVPPTGTAGSVFPGEGLAPDTTGSAESTSGRPDSRLFDQTNGLVDTEGDSDGTALSDTASAAEREQERPTGPGVVPPAGGSLGQH